MTSLPNLDHLNPEQLSPDQAILLDDLIDTDIAAIEAELEALVIRAKTRE
ncbi:hypothetical protein [Pseudomonas fluorescens]|nr:hypothetical protein [Pseudomonas fluorescens]